METRERIIEAATRTVVASGPSVLSMRQIAERSNVAVGTLTYHFPDKQLLLEECLTPLYDTIEATWAAVRDELHLNGPTPAVAEQYCRHLICGLRKHRNLVRLRILLAMDEGEVPADRSERFLDRYAVDAQPLFGLPVDELRLRFNSLYVLFARYCAMGNAELMRLTGGSTPDEASKRLETHLVHAGLRVLGLG